MRHFSAWAGGFALGIMMIPIALRSTEEFLRQVPRNLREASLALGATRWQMILTAVVPAAMRGIVSGIMLDIARVAGETAPLLFTSFGNRFWSDGFDKPTASLPVMIFTYAIGPYEDWHRQAWAAGFVLLAMVFMFNVTARLLMSWRRSRVGGVNGDYDNWTRLRKRRCCQQLDKNGWQAGQRRRSRSGANEHPHSEAHVRTLRRPAAASNARPIIRAENFSLYYGAKAGVQGHHAWTSTPRSRHGHHRPQRLRQEHVPAQHQPDERPDPGTRGEGG